MKIEIEIDEETAACIWADQTWSGLHEKSLPQILVDCVRDEAGNYKTSFPGAVPKALAAFRSRHPLSANAPKARERPQEAGRAVAAGSAIDQTTLIRHRNIVGGVYVEESLGADNLAVVLCSYFSKHMDRPENDAETDDNFFWGDWVMEKANKAMDLIAAEIYTDPKPQNAQRSRENVLPSSDAASG